jgi:hypothetical protein
MNPDATLASAWKVQLSFLSQAKTTPVRQHVLSLAGNQLLWSFTTVLPSTTQFFCHSPVNIPLPKRLSYPSSPTQHTARCREDAITIAFAARQ